MGAGVPWSTLNSRLCETGHLRLQWNRGRWSAYSICPNESWNPGGKNLSTYLNLLRRARLLILAASVAATPHLVAADEFDDRVTEFIGDPIGFAHAQDSPVVERFARAALATEGLEGAQQALIFDALAFAHWQSQAHGKAQEVLEERVMGGLTTGLSSAASFSPRFRDFFKEVHSNAAAKLAHVQQQLQKADRQLDDGQYDAARSTVNNVLVVNPRSVEARELLDTISRTQAEAESGGGSNMMLIAGGGAVLVGGAVFLLSGGEEAPAGEDLGTIDVTVDIPPN